MKNQKQTTYVDCIMAVSDEWPPSLVFGRPPSLDLLQRNALLAVTDEGLDQHGRNPVPFRNVIGEAILAVLGQALKHFYRQNL